MTPGRAPARPRPGVAVMFLLVLMAGMHTAAGRNPVPSDIGGPAELRFFLDICDPYTTDTTIYISNTGGSPITVTKITVVNDSTFSVSSPSAFPATIPPNMTLPVVVRFHPRTPGLKFGSLTIHSSAANTAALTIPLYGRKESAELAALSVYFGTLTPAQFPRTKQLTITNNGTLSVRVDSARFGAVPPFDLLSGFPVTIPPGGSTQITIRFRDPVTDGYHSDTLTIFPDPSCGPMKILVAGSRMSSAIISGPSTLNLDSMACGAAVRDTAIRVSNSGVFDLVIDTISVTGHPDISVPTGLPRTIAPGASDTILVRFQTRTPGFKAATITFSNNSSNQPKYLVTVSLLVETVEMAADPVDFGTRKASELPQQTMTQVRNNSTVAVRIDSARFRRPTPFACVTGFPMTVAANGSTSLTIRFNDPGTNGTFTDTLMLYTSPSCAVFEVEVTGARRSLPVLDSLPAKDFGTFPCSPPNRDTTIFLRNTGGGDLHVTSITLAGNSAFSIARRPAVPLTLPPGRVDSIVVHYQTVALGDHDAVLTIVSDAENQPVCLVPLHGRIDAIRLATSDVAFGSLQPPQFPVSRKTAIINTGTLPVTVVDARLAGTQPFTRAAGLPATIAPGDSLVVTITFNLPPADGSFTDSLDITYAPSCASYRIRVSGTRLSLPGIDAAGQYAFAPLLCPGSTRDTLVSIRNTGSGILTVQSASLTGDPDFTLIPAFSPFTIAPASSATLRVRFAPRTTGLKSANLTITSDAANLPVLTIGLSGRKDSTSIAVNTPAVFDTVTVPSFPAQRTIEIVNTGTVPVTITGITAAAPFSCSGGVPATIAPGTKSYITMRFDDPGKDTSIIEQYAIVADPSCIPTVQAISGTRTTATAVLEVGSVHAAPGALVQVPVYLRSARYLALAGVNGFNTWLRFNKTMLAPRFASTSSIDGEDRVINLLIPAAAAQDQVIAQLSFTAGLGTGTSTPLALERVVSIGGAADITAIPGVFTLDNVCREGGTRLVNMEGRLALAQNAPNPFNPLTDIEYEIIEPGAVLLAVIDRLGRVVATPVDASLSAGRYRVRFDATELPSGVYTYMLQSGARVLTRRMIVMK
jgi:hypothetical protein